MFQYIPVIVNNPSSTTETIDPPIYEGTVSQSWKALVPDTYHVSAEAADGEIYDAILVVGPTDAILKPSPEWYAAMMYAFASHDAHTGATYLPGEDANDPKSFWQVWYGPYIDDEYAATVAVKEALNEPDADTLGDGENQGVAVESWEWGDAYTHVAFIGNHVTKSTLGGHPDAPSDRKYGGRWFIEWGSKFTGFNGGLTATSLYMHDDPQVVAKAIRAHYLAHPAPTNMCPDCGAATVTGQVGGVTVEFNHDGYEHMH